MQRVLVTGGMGFIGSHLVQELLQFRENHVTVVDSLINHVLQYEGMVADLTQNAAGELDVRIESINDFQPADRFDVIYHLASIVGPAGVLDRAGRIVESVVTDAYRIARVAINGGSRLINVSTSEVYGGGDAGFCSEQAPRVIRGPATARQEYAAGKLAVEVALANLCQRGELDVVTVRPFNVAGVRQLGRGGFVLPRFLGQAITGRPITVFGDGSQVRAFTDARDVAAGLLLAAQKGKAGGTYNVGNPDNRITIDDLADRVIAITGAVAGKQYVDPRTIYGPTYAEAPDKFPDAKRIMQLGWRPQFDLDATIRDTLEWLRTLPAPLLLGVTGIEVSERLGKVGTSEQPAAAVRSRPSNTSHR